MAVTAIIIVVVWFFISKKDKKDRAVTVDICSGFLNDNLVVSVNSKDVVRMLGWLKVVSKICL